MMKQLYLTFLLTMFTLCVSAVPAKPGTTRVLTLTDGATVSALLVGDEHGHFWRGADGKCYQLAAGTDVYQEVDGEEIVQKASQKRAQANARRSRHLAPRKVGAVGSITGEKKGLIILVNFTDITFQAADDNALYQRIANEVNFSEGYFKGSMYDYFYAQSDGQFRLTFDIVGPVTVSQPQVYYGGNDSNGNDKHPAAMVCEALQLVDSQVNFADYDWNNDGTVEQVYVVYAGQGEADGGAENTIWPHEWTLSSAKTFGDGTGSQRLDGRKIDTYACGSELNGSGVIAGIGTMCHEFSHCLGYPDFYDTDYTGGQGMFMWDLMDSGSYNGDGYQPAGYTSYERWVAGWKEPTELTSTQTISNMSALQTTGSNTYVIYNKANRNEYFLLENRQKTGWDASLPGEGLLILHVDYDATVWSNNEPNDDPSHQRMTWVPADNVYQYVTSNNTKYYTQAGAKNDPFPYGSVNAFNRYTTPAATLYNNNSDGTKYLDSSVEGITQNSDGTISFNFVGADDLAEPTPSETPLLYEGLSRYESTGDGTSEIPTTCNYLDYTKWTAFSKIYAGGTSSGLRNGGCLKFGSSNAVGSMTADNLSLTGSGTLTFYLKKYNSDTGKLDVSVTGATADVTQFKPTNEWTLCTVNLTNAAGAVTITLATSSKRAYVDEITLTPVSTSVAPTPELIADPDVLTFETEANTSQVKTFDILGADLTGDVTVTLTGAANVFSVSQSTVSKADAEEGATVSVTFAPTAAGTYTGTATVSSEGAEPVTVSLSATATASTTPEQPVSSGNEFTLVTQASDFTDGDYIIVYGDAAMNTTITNNRLQYTSVTPTNNVITTTEAAIIWHISKSGDYYTICNAGANKYAASTGTKNEAQLLVSGTDDKALWSVSTGATFDFTNKHNAGESINATLRRNGTYGFACYSTQTGGALSLYKRNGSTGGGGDTPDPAMAYYQPADGKKGAALKTAMCGIILPHTQRTYDNLWTDFQSTDKRSDGKVWDMYSGTSNFTFVTDQAGNFEKEGDKYNREHSFPKSWFGEATPMYTDLHHIYPTDGFVNGKRSNYPFGETSNPTYTSNGGFSKLGTCSYPGYNGTVFEPADEYKGDFARTYFYMVTCYENLLPTWYSNNTEARPTLDGNTYPGLSEWQLNMLMKWAKNDPVSEKETARNNAVYAIQNNRNPFIDYPGLQEYIWGICVDDAFSYDHYVVPVYTDDPTPDPVSDSDIFAKVTDASTLAAGDKILIAYVNGDIKRALSTTQNTNNRAATDDVTLNTDGTLTPGTNAQVITLEKDGNNFLFNVGNGYLYAASSSANHLKTETTADDNDKATIAISSDNATITFQGTYTRNVIRYNPNNGSPIFSCYASTSTTGSLPQIYRMVQLPEIALANAADNSTTLSTYNGKMVNATLAGRTLWKDGSWNTLCLPFDVTIADSPLAGDGVTVKELNAATSKFEAATLTLEFADVTTTLTAGKPYIVKWNQTDSHIVNPKFEKVTVSSTAPTGVNSQDGKVTFLGTYSPAVIYEAAAAKTKLYLSDANTLYYPTAEGFAVNACRAYFCLNDGLTAGEPSLSQQAVRTFVLNFGDEDTQGVKAIDNHFVRCGADAWYTLDGRRLSRRPTATGIYVNNGRKVVIK